MSDNQKKITLVSSHYMPEQGAAVNRINEIVKSLIENNFKVDIITAMPTYPGGSKKKKYRFKLLLREKGVFGERITRLFTTDWKKKKFIYKLLNQLIFAFALNIYLLRFLIIRKKIFLISSPSFFSIFPVFLLKLLNKNTIYFLDIRDPYPASLFELTSLNKESLPATLLLCLEYYFYINANLIFTISDSAVEYIFNYNKFLESRIELKNKFKVIYNGVSKSFLNVQPADLQINELKENDEKKFIVLYAGTFGKAENIEMILETAALLSNSFPEIIFIFIGDGEKREIIDIESKKYENIILKDPVPHQEIANYINVSNAGISIRNTSPVLEIALPSKIFEFLACGLPVIYGGRGEAKTVIQRVKGGIVVDSKNVIDFKNAVLNMYKNLKTFKIDSNYIIENFSREAMSDKMIKYIQSGI